MTIGEVAGMSLSDIQAFLSARDPAARKDVLRRNLRAAQARIAALQSAADLLDAGLNCSHDEITSCPNYRRHLTELVDPPDGSAHRGDRR